MKRKIFYLILALMAITTIIAITNGSDIIPKIATKTKTPPKEPIVQKQEKLNMKEPIEVSNMFITINSATLTKKYDKMPKFDGLENYLADYPGIDETKSFDDKGNFIDHNNYIWLGVTWENPTDEDRELYLNSFEILSDGVINGECIGKEPLLISNILDYTKKDTFARTLKSKDKITFYIGYTITDQELTKFKDRIYILLNFNGTNLMNYDKDRRSINLNFD